MNKYIVLSAAALVISLSVGCQNCGYKTAHCSRYQTLVGTTRLASPQTNCRYNACGVCNTCINSCSPCNACSTQMLANNSPLYSNAYAQDANQSGWYQSYAGENASSSASLLDGTQQTAQSEAPLRWRRVTEEEQQYANSSVDPTSAGVASALSAPAFGSPAPASALAPQYPNSSRRAARGVASALETPDYPAPGAAPQYPGQYSGQYPPRHPNSSPRAARGVASALDTPGYPTPDAAPQYPGQYAGQYPNGYSRATAGVGVPNHPLPPQYSNQYPNSPRVASGVNPSYNVPSYGAPGAETGSEPLRWRHATEEEQQYYNSPHRANGTGQENPAYGADQSLTVPVYSSDNASGSQPQGNLSMPEIDPNALPSLNPESGTF